MQEREESWNCINRKGRVKENWGKRIEKETKKQKIDIEIMNKVKNKTDEMQSKE